MGTEQAPAPVWEPLVYFWNGGWIGVGDSLGEVPPHTHHAIQVSVGLNGPVRLRHEDAEWREMETAVVLPDTVHAFDGCGSTVAMIFVEPESPRGVWLQDSLVEAITSVPRERLAAHLATLLAFREERPDPVTAARIVTGVIDNLCAGPPPLRRMDSRIVQALRAMRDRDVRRLSLDEAAKSVFLSPSRFAHLFTDEVGVPFRRYLLWRKLSRAMQEFGRGANLTAAAHAAGFSDSAHLTRTWRQMFGITPTVMMGRARFYEIPAPFELVDAAEEAGAWTG